MIIVTTAGPRWTQGADAEVCSLVLEAPEVVPLPFFGAEYPTAVSFQTTGCGLTTEAKLTAELGQPGLFLLDVLKEGTVDPGAGVSFSADSAGRARPDGRASCCFLDVRGGNPRMARGRAQVRT